MEDGKRSLGVLVTGSAGYIGAVLVPLLLEEGHRVVGTDTCYFEEPNSGLPLAAVPMVHKDVRDLTPSDIQGFDAVIHLSALCNDPLGDLNPAWTYDINHQATVRLARLAKDAGVQRFLYSSSCSLYGASTEDFATEEAPLRPLTPYAVSKVRSEDGLAKLADADFSPVYMRNATAYGWSPRLRADVVLNNLVCWAHTTGKVRILSDGTPWRPVVHVADIAAAFAVALVAPREAIHNQAFNVGTTDENYQVRELAEIVRETVPGCTIEYGRQAGPDARNYRVDFSKLKRLLPDFQPRWNARRGAREVYDQLRRHSVTLEDFQGRKYIRLAQLKHLISQQALDAELRWQRERAVHG
jgi:nucleoside-diphosphate-sugar epimerase